MRTKHLFTGATIPQIVLIDPRPALHTINASFRIMFAPSRTSRKKVPGELSTTPKRESIYPSPRRLRGRRGIDDQARADFACDRQAASRNAADPDSRVDRVESQQPETASESDRTSNSSPVARSLTSRQNSSSIRNTLTRTELLNERLPGHGILDLSPPSGRDLTSQLRQRRVDL